MWTWAVIALRGGLTCFDTLPVFELICDVTREHGVQQGLCFQLFGLKVLRQDPQLLLKKAHIYHE